MKQDDSGDNRIFSPYAVPNPKVDGKFQPRPLSDEEREFQGSVEHKLILVWQTEQTALNFLLSQEGWCPEPNTRYDWLPLAGGSHTVIGFPDFYAIFKVDPFNRFPDEDLIGKSKLSRDARIEIVFALKKWWVFHKLLPKKEAVYTKKRFKKMAADIQRVTDVLFNAAQRLRDCYTAIEGRFADRMPPFLCQDILRMIDVKLPAFLADEDWSRTLAATTGEAVQEFKTRRGRKATSLGSLVADLDTIIRKYQLVKFRKTKDADGQDENTRQRNIEKLIQYLIFTGIHQRVPLRTIASYRSNWPIDD